METVLLSAGMLSRFIVLNSALTNHHRGYAHTNDDGSVLLGEESVFSPLVKIEAERATVNDRYVNLRFCHNNRYWQKNANDDFIVAVSNKPEEDTTKSSCTLFEAVRDSGGIYLVHVGTGRNVMINNSTMMFFVNNNPVADLRNILSFVNWDTLVKLPENVAFKGYNDRYLQGVWAANRPFLQFAADDPNRPITGYRISLLPDGHVRIFSNHFTRFWRRDNRAVNSGWIWADSTDDSPNDINTRFWPVKLDDDEDDDIIALRNAGNNNFCKALTADGFTDCLDAIAPTIFNEARLKVEELVMGRTIYNVETVLLSAGMLSRFIAIQSVPDTRTGYYAMAAQNNSQVRLFSDGLFSVGVKIEVERATSNDRYVHLRFCNTNKYWQVRGTGIFATASKPEEDTTHTQASSTLFEPVRVNNSGVFSLIHVQSRLRVFVISNRFDVGTGNQGQQSNLTFVNMDSVVKLPKNVAFKGFNDKYLRGIIGIVGGILGPRNNYLQFSLDDPNAKDCAQEVELMRDGHVRIKSKIFDRFWRRDDRAVRSGWIWADAADTPANARNVNTHFWPVKLDDNTIALRNVGNNNFCRIHTDGMRDCLDAIAPSMVNDARLVVEELVLGRRINNVRYWMENSRIFNESPFLAGTTTAFNYSGSEASIAVEVSYEDSKSESFSRSVSITTGLTTTIVTKVPFLFEGKIELSAEINTTLEWNKTTTTTKSVKATGTVPVPPRSVATVSYVGTTGSCDVPFSYTQQDQSSTDGKIIETEEADGMFTGVNSYNFSFVVERTRPL